MDQEDYEEGFEETPEERRERIAIKIYAETWIGYRSSTFEACASHAVAGADALIKELDRAD